MRGEGRKGSTDGPNHPALLLTVGIETKERRNEKCESEEFKWVKGKS